jgi:hypothetical protein
MKKVLTTLGLLSLAFSGTAQAFPHRWHQVSRPVVYSPWHSGYWHHGWHDGRAGWWWVNAGLWHLYTSPVYPYPPQPYVVEVPLPAPPPVIVPAPVPVPAMAPLPPPPPPVQTAVIPHLPTSGDNTLFYCASSNAYFPYVPNCAEGWELKQGSPAR